MFISGCAVNEIAVEDSDDLKNRNLLKQLALCLYKYTKNIKEQLMLKNFSMPFLMLLLLSIPFASNANDENDPKYLPTSLDDLTIEEFDKLAQAAQDIYFPWKKELLRREVDNRILNLTIT